MFVKLRLVAVSLDRAERGQYLCADLGAGAAKWKAGMLERAQGLFRKRGRDLESIIYGQTAAIADPQSRVSERSPW